MFTYEELSARLRYDPDTGQLTRLVNMQPVGMRVKQGGPIMKISNKEVSVRGVVVTLMTGRWPDPYQYRFVGDDPKDLRWCNFQQRLTDSGEQVCVKCGSAFNARHRTGKRKTRKWCGGCSTVQQSKSTIWRESEFKRRYGITEKLYNEQLELQGGGCAICGVVSEQDGRRLAVDHCHETGKLREILCQRCNTSIGAFNDDPKLLLHAAKYLLKHKPE